MRISYDFCLSSNFGFDGVKNIELAKTYANYIQSDRPYLGTCLQFLIVASNPSSTIEEILNIAYTFLDIAASPEQSPYAVKSLFASAQTIKYVTKQKHYMDVNLEKQLSDIAQRIFIDIGEYGVAEAYIMLSEMLELKAVNHVHIGDFTKAIDLYKQSIGYLKKITTNNEDLEYEARSTIESFNSELVILNYLRTDKESEKKTPSVTSVTSLPDQAAAESLEPLEDISDLAYIQWQQVYSSKATATKYKTRNTQFIFWTHIK